MSFEVSVDHEAGLIEIIWTGVASVSALTAYVDQVWTDPDVRGYQELIDFRRVTDVEVPSEAIGELAEYSRMFDNPERTARSALVAPPGLIYGLSRMFASMRALEPDDRRERRVFEGPDEALRWLAEIPAGGP